ncbi:uracil phosphoribosyltransferase homolog [Latimeria chalumnae]|uniref:uracil phosphoribosyltransferase homolog n=1 Tax=Latimeria chalumnae TaxID=7897 RepID=UPI0006D902BD|nr:PREDICTED: uracil phosphoribosyltransferase homolog [Latimeria chalumnae]|eukprot:XP_014346420.1 PREDICTED: uracil phosphoribosyltransferase homolog [Latimeria chalumnae]
MEADLSYSSIMPCHNQQISSGSPAGGAEHAVASKQVRFANNSNTTDNTFSAGQADVASSVPACDRADVVEQQIGPQLKLLPMNDQIRELQTIIRDKTTSRGDFVFCADRLIRLVVEEGLNQLPYTECTVTTPTGHKYEGVKFEKGNCGVSIMRSGEAMEQGLRDCCRSIRIGKILIQSDEETQKAKVYYAKFPPDIYRRKVLLMYPILSTGNTVIEAVKVLIEHGVQPSHIILLSLFSTPHGANSIIEEFPEITILTTEVHPVAPTHFGQKYFGTD